MKPKTNGTRLVAALAALVLLAGACGGTDETDTASETVAATTEPVVESTEVPPTVTPIPDPTSTPIPDPTATPAPTAMPEAPVDAGPIDAEDEAAIREEFVSEMMSGPDGMDRATAECMTDEVAAANGGFGVLADSGIDDPDLMTDEVIGAMMLCAIGTILGEGLEPAAVMERGYTQTEAECISAVVNDRLTIALEDLDNVAEPTADDEVAYADRLGECATPAGPTAGSAAPGTDAVLDVLWDACNDGSGASCQQLFSESGIDTDYEAFGETCGGRVIATTLIGSVNCGLYLDGEYSSTEAFADSLGVGDAGDIPAGSPAPGENAEMDVLWDRCNAGDGQACDDMFWEAPLGSVYEDYGSTCGGRGAQVSCADAMNG